jgi:hypothetical protein
LRYYHIIILLSLLLMTARVVAEELPAKVKYVAKSNIYIDVGRNNGAQVGDIGNVFREGDTIAQLEIVFVADKSSSCKVLEQNAQIIAGDSLVMNISQTPIINVPTIKRSPKKVPKTRTISELVDRSRKEKTNRLSGQIGAQYFTQNDQKEIDYDFSQPSFFVRAEIENIMGSHHSFSVRMRGRKNIRDRQLSDDSKTKWNNRIYQVALNYDNPKTDYSYRLGRIVPNGAGGLGYIDGLTFDYRLNEKTSVGAFGGTEPERETSNISGDVTKYGSYISFRNGSYSKKMVRSLLAFSGVYQKGEIDREFLYTQNSFSAGSVWSFFQSGELNVNRGWRKNNSNETLQLSAIQLSIRYRPIRSTTFTLAFNNRKNVRTYYNRSVADSLFDDASRQGFSIKSQIRLPLNLRLSASGSLRTRASDNSSTYSSSAGIIFYDEWYTRLRFTVRGNYFSNLYNEGIQNRISISRNLFRKIDIRVETGLSSYKLDLTNSTIENRWMKYDLDLRISKRVYSSIYYQINRGDSQDTNSMFVDLGIRF